MTVAAFAAGDSSLLTPSSYRNLIENPGFRIQQRGSSFTGVTESQVTFDRWRATIGGAAGVNVVDGGAFTGLSRHSAKVTRASGTGAFGLYQSIEREAFEPMKGKRVTFSAYVIKDSGLAGSLTMEIRTVTAEGGTTAVESATASTTAASMGAGVVRLSVTLDIPAGSSAQGMLVQIAATSQAGGASVAFYMTGAKLEHSSNGEPTPFELPPFALDVMACQRHYEKSFDHGIAPVQNSGVSGGSFSFPQTAAGTVSQCLGTVRLAVQKRIAPQVTLFNPSAANAQARNIATGADFTATTATHIGQNSFILTGTGPSGSADGNLCHVHWAAAADL